MSAGVTALLALASIANGAWAADIPPVVAAATTDADDPGSTAVALRDIDTRMTVAVTVNGAGPFRFIVDSGATRTVISRRLADLLHLPQAGAVQVHAVGGVSAVPSVRIAALGLGALPDRGIVAPVLEERDLGAAGILGIDALANRKVVIDLVHNRMTVEPGDRTARVAATDEIVVVAKRRFGQLVLMDADASGQRIWAVVDTGGMVTIGNDMLRARLVRRKRAAPVQTIITDVAGNQIVASYAAIGTIRLGSIRLENPVVAFSDTQTFSRFGLADKPSMLVGMDVMRAFGRVAIDFKRGTVRLTVRRDAKTDPLPQIG